MGVSMSTSTSTKWRCKETVLQVALSTLDVVSIVAFDEHEHEMEVQRKFISCHIL